MVFGAPWKMIMTKLLYSPAVSFNLVFLGAATDLGHTFRSNIEGTTIYLKEGGEIFFPHRGQANYLGVTK